MAETTSIEDDGRGFVRELGLVEVLRARPSVQPSKTEVHRIGSRPDRCFERRTIAGRRQDFRPTAGLHRRLLSSNPR